MLNQLSYLAELFFKKESKSFQKLKKHEKYHKKNILLAYATDIYQKQNFPVKGKFKKKVR